MRIIITGTGGRLGAAMARALRDTHRVVACDRTAMDLTVPEKVRDRFEALEFDAVINCAAVTALDYCEQHPEEARAVNAMAPALMAAFCQARGVRMIHFSTDYVYDGTREGRRCEQDPVAPLGVYARTKLNGEAPVLAAGGLVLRTSWVFGPDRESFVDQIIRRAQREDGCGAIADKFSSPSYSMDMAAVMAHLLDRPDVRGVLNCCNDGVCSWHSFGQAALDMVAALGLRLKTRHLEPLHLADMTSFIAPRPVHTGMEVTALAQTTGFRPRSWQHALEDYLQNYYQPAPRGGGS